MRILTFAGVAAALFTPGMAQAVPGTPVAPIPRAPATVEATVLGRTVARGEVLGADDFTTAQLMASQARNTLTPNQAAGREAVRNLAAGSSVRSTDLIAPRLVRRGEPVTITIRSGALAIATSGKALASGGQGEFVRVVSASTNRTLDGVVEGPNAVRVSAP